MKAHTQHRKLIPGLSPGLYLQYAAPPSRFSKNQHNTFQIKFNPLLFGRGERVHALVEFDVVRAFPVPHPGDGAIFRSVSSYRSRESKRYLTSELQVHFFSPTLTPEAICSWNRSVMLCTYLCFKLKHNRDFR